LFLQYVTFVKKKEKRTSMQESAKALEPQPQGLAGVCTLVFVLLRKCG